MKSIVLVSGPHDAGPGEREVMLARATAVFEQFEVDDVTRIDVPGRGSGDEQSDAGMRLPVQTLIPALQSGSLFGDRIGVLVVDAQGLLKAEAEVIAEVLSTVDESAVVAVFVASGSVTAPLGKMLKSHFVPDNELRRERGFTYSTICVRPKGEPIKTFGGTASGPGISAGSISL